MPATELGFADYLREAFHRRVKIPALGGLPLNYLGIASASVAGLFNPGFWLLGAALEIGWLFGAASSQRFQKLIQAEKMLAEKKTWETQVQEAVARLGPSSQERYRRLLTQCQRILGISETLDDGGLVDMRKMRTGGLNQILWIFLRLLASREVLEENLARINPVDLDAEIRDLERRLAKVEGVSDEKETESEAPSTSMPGVESALARSLRGTLEIQRKRLENLQRSRESLAVIDAELERIEHQVVLIREESAVSGKAEILSSRLDAVSGALDDTNRWMEQNASIFGELGADPLGTAPADLPDLPAFEAETA